MAQLWNPNAPCADLNTERGLRRLTQLILGTETECTPRKGYIIDAKPRRHTQGKIRPT